jgi:hypothetical protein
LSTNDSFLNQHAYKHSGSQQESTLRTLGDPVFLENEKYGCCICNPMLQTRHNWFNVIEAILKGGHADFFDGPGQ